MNNPQSKYRTLIAIIVLLLVTNIAVLAYFMMNKKSNSHEKAGLGLKTYYKKRLALTNSRWRSLKN